MYVCISTQLFSSNNKMRDCLTLNRVGFKLRLAVIEEHIPIKTAPKSLIERV